MILFSVVLTKKFSQDNLNLEIGLNFYFYQESDKDLIYTSQLSCRGPVYQRGGLLRQAGQVPGTSGGRPTYLGLGGPSRGIFLEWSTPTWTRVGVVYESKVDLSLSRRPYQCPLPLLMSIPLAVVGVNGIDPYITTVF